MVLSPRTPKTDPFFPEPDPEGTAVTPVPTPRGSAGEAYLVHIHPPGSAAGGRHRLGPKPVIIGRDSGCTILDPDPSVSRRHAIIILQSDGKFLLTDLGSTNGTAVNDVRIESAVLADGDHLRIGNSVYRFLAGGKP